MENRRIKTFFTLLLSAITSLGFGDDGSFLNDAFYRNGKYYVVVLILSIIFIAIIAYLVSLDRKVSKIEKELTDEN